MKKHTFLLTFAFLVFLLGQTYAQLDKGITVGLNMANFKYNYENNGGEPTTTTLIAPRVGLTLDLNLPGPIGLGTGLFYSGKGATTDLEETYKDDYDKVEVDGYQRTNLGYVEVPLHIKYKIAVLNIYMGPYVAMGVSGKQKNDYTIKGTSTIAGIEVTNELKESEDYKVKYTGKVEKDAAADKFYVAPLDYGLDFGLGVKVTKIGAYLGYSLGLANISPDREAEVAGKTVTIDADDFKTTNGAIQLGVTYYF